MVQAIQQTTRFIEVDDEGHRHWCPESEKFAPADALMGALEQGWRIMGIVFRQEHWHTAGRRVPVYHFKLERDDCVLPIAVVDTPYISRLLIDLKIRVVRINERKQQSSQERW